MIKQAIVVRRLLEPWFGALSNEHVEKFIIILRVDGSLGSFGPEGVENLQLVDRVLECELVIADQGWDDLSELQITELLQQRILEAIVTCFDGYDIAYDRNELREVFASCS